MYKLLIGKDRQQHQCNHDHCSTAGLTGFSPERKCPSDGFGYGKFIMESICTYSVICTCTCVHIFYYTNQIHTIKLWTLLW